MRKYKHHILYIVIATILLGLITINNGSNVSALSYQSNVGIGFTFNPTLSVSISPSDLIIPNITPGTAVDSNNITVSVATNAVYGYTLSAMMDGNNSDLTHTDDSINNSINNGNSNNVFSSIATDSSLPNLVTDNTWGYSYKLSNDPNWNNYSGLSTETSKTLVDSNDQTAKPIDFKIAAKAASTQTSGTYAGTINFTAVSKSTPMNLAESYFAAGKTRHNGYYTMQDMTSEICNNTEVIGEGSQTQLIDLRDDKVYWATKLADGHCWMTQNLDLDLDSNRTYAHWDTDLGWSILDNNAEWKPTRNTINFSGDTINDWKYGAYSPYSANPGDIYYYTSNSDADDIQYDSLQECTNAEYNDCVHYHAGNYYNWSAAVASNDTSNLITQYDNAPNSICPANWRLPITASVNGDLQEYKSLLEEQSIIAQYGYYVENGFNNIRKAPIYMVRTGHIMVDSIGTLKYIGNRGYYGSATVHSYIQSNSFAFLANRVYYAGTNSDSSMQKVTGIPIRCLAR